MEIATFKVKMESTNAMLVHLVPELLKEEVRLGRKLTKEGYINEKLKPEHEIPVHEGYIGIPRSWLISSLVDAGRFVKQGKFKVSTLSGTQLFSLMKIENKEVIPFTHCDNGMIDLSYIDSIKRVEYREGERPRTPRSKRGRALVDANGLPVPWELDVRKGAHPQYKKETMVIERACFPVWKSECLVDVYTKQVHPDTIKEVFEIAGGFGLGAFRPGPTVYEFKQKNPDKPFQNKCPFGTWKLVSWEEVGFRNEGID